MKALIAALLTPVMLLAFIGLTVHKHYCAGELASVSISPGVGCSCGDKTDMPAGCCRDVAVFVKFEEDSLVTAFKLSHDHTVTPIPQPVVWTVQMRQSFLLTDYLHYRPPPLANDLTILLQSFLI